MKSADRITDMTQRQAIMIALKNGPVTSRGIAKEFNLKPDSISGLLGRMWSEKTLHREKATPPSGGRRQFIYRLVDQENNFDFFTKKKLFEVLVKQTKPVSANMIYPHIKDRSMGAINKALNQMVEDGHIIRKKSIHDDRQEFYDHGLVGRQKKEEELALAVKRMTERQTAKSSVIGKDIVDVDGLIDAISKLHDLKDNLKKKVQELFQSTFMEINAVTNDIENYAMKIAESTEESAAAAGQMNKKKAALAAAKKEADEAAERLKKLLDNM